MISFIDIQKAQNRIAPYIRETPIEFSHSLLEEIGLSVHLKLENWQVSGSFKPRGGLNKIIKTWEKNPKAQFVAPTAGGHGVGFSYAAKQVGAVAHIFMPKTADPDRIIDIERNGASIKLFDSVPEARKEALRLQEEKGYVFVSAYNDVEMIEGAGSMALELIKQVPNIDCLVCGVGGGGYLAGMAIVLKALNPSIKIVGVQQENGSFLAEWFQTGRYPAHRTFVPSIAEGIGAQVEESTITWPYLRDLADDFIIISEDDIRETLQWTLRHHKLFVEPSGIVGLAGIRKYPERFRGLNQIASVITGRNVSYEKFIRIIS